MLQMPRPHVNNRFMYVGLTRDDPWPLCFSTCRIPISISELVAHQVGVRDGKPWKCSLQLMKICLEIASSRVAGKKLAYYCKLCLVIKNRSSLQLCHITTHQIFKASNELSAFYHSLKLGHFHSLWSDIRAITIQIETQLRKISE